MKNVYKKKWKIFERELLMGGYNFKLNIYLL